MEQRHYIYKITNTINQKVYIGQTIDPESRWTEHKSDAKTRAKYPLHRAINKNGFLNFTFEILATCFDQIAADEAEIAIITRYDSLNPDRGYNIRAGGNVHPPTNKTKLTSEQEQQILLDYQTGQTMHDIKKIYHISPVRIAQILRTNNIHIRTTTEGMILGPRPDHVKNKISKSHMGIHQKHFTSEQEQEILKLVQSGRSQNSVAKQFNVNSVLIWRTIKRLS